MPTLRFRTLIFRILEATKLFQVERHAINKPSLDQSARLLSTKLVRATVFSWTTLVSVVISQYEIHGFSFSSNHFIAIAILAPLCTFLAALSAYIVNDLTDVNVDMINSPQRPLTTRAATTSDAILLMLLLDAGALSFASLLGMIAFLIILVEIVGGIMYSFKPFGIKNRFVWKTLAIAFAGLVSSIFGAMALGQGVTLMVWYAALMSFAYLFVTSPLNDLGDTEGDSVVGRRTIPIILGQENTIKLSMVASIVPFVTSFAFFKIGTPILMTAILAIISLRSLQLLVPLLESDRETIRKRHGEMIVFHFVLQAAILVGAVSLPM